MKEGAARRELERLRSRLVSAAPAEVLAKLTRLTEDDREAAMLLGSLFPEALQELRHHDLLQVVGDRLASPRPGHNRAPVAADGETADREGQTWSQLPSHLARSIFSRLFCDPAHSVQAAAAAARLVCRSWSEDVAAACKKVTLRRRPGASGLCLHEVCKVFPNLESLDATGAPLTAIHASRLESGGGTTGPPLSSLQRLRVSQQPHEDTMEHLTQVTELDLERLDWVDFHDVGFYRSLALLPHLRSLKMPQKRRDLRSRDGRLTDEAARSMAHATSRLERFSCPDAALLSDAGLAALRLAPARMTSLWLEKCYKFGAESLAAVQQLTSLTSLSLVAAPITTEAVAAIARSLPLLCDLELNGCYRLGDAAAEALLPLRGTLSGLQVGGWAITHQGVRSIAALRGLTFLVLEETALNDQGMEHLKPLAGTMQDLLLGGTDITSRGLACLRDFTALTELDIVNTNAVGFTGAHALAEIRAPRLKYLNAAVSIGSHNGIGNDGARDLAANHPWLRELFLGGMKLLGSGGAEHLARLTELRRLSLNDTGVRGSGLSHLLSSGALQHLWELELADCPGLNDRTLSQGLRLPALRVLNLSRCHGLGDAGLRSLGALRHSLEIIHLKGCTKITDAGVAFLARLVHLQDIDLRLCNLVTAAGVAALQRLERLKSVLLYGTAVSTCGWAALLDTRSRAFAACLDIKAVHYTPWWRPGIGDYEAGMDSPDIDNYEFSDTDSDSTDHEGQFTSDDDD